MTIANDAYCWGDNSMMELGAIVGKISDIPVPVAGDHAMSMVTTSDMSHTCGLGTTRILHCWGYNRFGQVGNGSTADEPTPIIVVGDLRFAYVQAGYMRTCGISDDGRVYCWGRGGHVRLGNIAVTLEICSGLPCTMVPTPTGATIGFRTLSTGATHTCAVTTEGSAFCWGRNAGGQLGIGPADSTVVPTPVTGGLVFSEISAAHIHTCAVTTSSEVFCWGYNGDGRLGTGSSIGSDSPQKVVNSDGFVSASTGHTHSCAVSYDGRVYCWGDNGMGQLGDGTRSPSATPVQVVFP
ncbi:MAG: hypothetical protein O7E49_06160 [Gemmatimonadetes bacterium]|nr:hypothetical protein [Gemmatimonadota bacterium]